MNPNSQEFKNREAVREFLIGEMESMTVPEQVSHYAQGQSGKALTVRDLRKLKELTGLEWFIRKQYGMTHIETRGYQRRRYSDDKTIKNSECVSLLMGHSETNVLWMDTAALEDKNGAYFEGARRRNKLRMEGANDPKFLDRLFSVTVNTAKAIRELKRQKELFDELTAYGEPGEPDCYDLQKICGLYSIDLDKR